MKKKRYCPKAPPMAIMATLALFLFGSSAELSGNLLAQTISSEDSTERKVTGRVTDSSSQEGLPGVNVVVKNSTIGTVTDVQGNFALNVPDSANILVFSSVGFDITEVEIGNKSSINVGLQPETKALSEVVVIGYGTIEKEDLTSSVAQVKAEALEERSITSLTEGLAGQVTGVQVQQSSGVPGAPLNIKVRGSNTISASSEPLYVVDGIPMEDITGINPNDISSVEVLKDASSAAIYGARGAGGVVLITTKKGQKGEPTFNFTGYYGLQKVDKIIDVMDTREYAAFNIYRANEAYLRSGGNLNDPLDARPDNLSYPESFLNPGELPNTNWQDVIYQIAPIQNYQLTASGGGDIGNFLISGAYLNQDGIIQETGYERINFRVNGSLNVGKRLTFGMNIAPSFSTQNDPDSQGKESVVHHSQNMPPIVPLNSNTEELGYVEGSGTFPNPLYRLQEVHAEMKQNNFLTNVWGELSITDDLLFRSQFGYNLRESQLSYFSPSNVSRGNPSIGEARGENTYNWSVQNTLTYYLSLDGTHNFDFLLGQSAEKTNYNDIIAIADGYPNDLIYTLNVAANPKNAETTEFQNSLASFFGRVQYNFRDKYLFSASVRQDGSSRFGSDTKWGLFPSASIGWKIDREGFLSSASWLSLLKVRASWGRTGNDRIGNYDHIALLDVYNYSLNGSVVSGLSPTTLGNPDLGWETTTTTDIGIDIGAFNNRLQITIDGYINDTEDLLLDVPIPSISGYETNRKNTGSVQNKGFEFDINSQNLDGALRWNTSLNFSKNINEVTSLGEENAPLVFTTQGYDAYITQVGDPIGSFYMLKSDGLLMPEDFDNEGNALVPIANGQIPGNIQIVDVNNDGKINADDETIVGNNFPDFIWGVTNTFQYKGFDLRVFFQGSQGGDVFFLGARHLDRGAGTINQLSRWVHSWKPEPAEGQNPIPQNSGVDMSWDGKTPYMFGNNPSYNDTWIYDASFIRLKNITLGYNFPEGILQKIGIQKARVYVMGDNVFTWTNYPGATPETNSDGNDTTEPGTDYGTYPLSRRYSLGINLTF